MLSNYISDYENALKYAKNARGEDLKNARGEDLHVDNEINYRLPPIMGKDYNEHHEFGEGLNRNPEYAESHNKAVKNYLEYLNDMGLSHLHSFIKSNHKEAYPSRIEGAVNFPILIRHESLKNKAVLHIPLSSGGTVNTRGSSPRTFTHTHYITGDVAPDEWDNLSREVKQLSGED
jgi:hypothetical protein